MPLARLFVRAFELLILAILSALLHCGCSPERPAGAYDRAALKNVTAYRFRATHSTLGGVWVDDPRGQLDLAAVDFHVDALETCLARLGPIDNHSFADAACLDGFSPRQMPATLDRTRFAVKVPPDWRPACSDPAEETFPCDVGPGPCLAKGLQPTPECPCACRAVVQDNYVVLTTPNLRLFRAELLRLVTGCNLVWTTYFRRCL